MKFTIKAIRVVMDIKTKELATRFGVSDSFISSIEAGRTKIPEYQLEAFASFAGISFADIQLLIELFERGVMGINEIEISKYAAHYNVDKSFLYQLAEIEASGKPFKDIYFFSIVMLKNIKNKLFPNI